MKIEKGSTDEKIVSATFRLLKKEGSDKTTTKKIAAEAEVNEVTIFRNFGNKKKLIEVTKDHYMGILIDKLNEIFEFDEDDTIEVYLKRNFIGVLNLPDSDFSIIKIAIQELNEIPEKKLLILDIVKVILNKLESFFELQKQKGTINMDVDTHVLTINWFGVVFQSVILWKLYHADTDEEGPDYSQEFLNILFNGIKP